MNARLHALGDCGDKSFLVYLCPQMKVCTCIRLCVRVCAGVREKRWRGKRAGLPRALLKGSTAAKDACCAARRGEGGEERRCSSALGANHTERAYLEGNVREPRPVQRSHGQRVMLMQPGVMEVLASLGLGVPEHAIVEEASAGGQKAGVGNGDVEGPQAGADARDETRPSGAPVLYRQLQVTSASLCCRDPLHPTLFCLPLSPSPSLLPAIHPSHLSSLYPSVPPSIWLSPTYLRLRLACEAGLQTSRPHAPMSIPSTDPSL